MTDAAPSAAPSAPASSPAAAPSSTAASPPPSETGSRDAPSQSTSESNVFAGRDAKTVSPPHETPKISPRTLDHLRRRGQQWDDGDGSEEVVDIDSPSTDVRRSPAVDALLAEDAPQPRARPADMPLAVPNSEIDKWLSLPDEARALLQVRYADADRGVREAQQRAAEAQRQYEAKRQQDQQQWTAIQQQRQAERAQYEAAINASLAALEPEMAQFRAIRTEEDLKRLHAENPAAAARFIEVGNRAHELFRRGAQVVAQRQREAQHAWQQANAGRAQQHQQYVAAQRAAHEKWARQQDEAVNKSVPELRDGDREKVAEFQQRAKRHLKDSLGLSDQEIDHHYNYGALRDARVQKMVLNSLRWEEAQRRARSAMPVVSTPLKPGHSNGSFAPTNLSTIAEAGDMKSYIAARAKGRSR
jgi:hypothetical protein